MDKRTFSEIDRTLAIPTVDIYNRKEFAYILPRTYMSTHRYGIQYGQRVKIYDPIPTWLPNLIHIRTFDNVYMKALVVDLYYAKRVSSATINKIISRAVDPPITMYKISKNKPFICSEKDLKSPYLVIDIMVEQRLANICRNARTFVITDRLGTTLNTRVIYS